MKYLGGYISYSEMEVLYGSTLGGRNNQEEYTKRRIHIYHISEMPDKQYNMTNTLSNGKVKAAFYSTAGELV